MLKNYVFLDDIIFRIIRTYIQNKLEFCIPRWTDNLNKQFEEMNQRAINTDEKSDLLRDNESQRIYFCKDKVDNVILL